MSPRSQAQVIKKTRRSGGTGDHPVSDTHALHSDVTTTGTCTPSSALTAPYPSVIRHRNWHKPRRALTASTGPARASTSSRIVGVQVREIAYAKRAAPQSNEPAGNRAPRETDDVSHPDGPACTALQADRPDDMGRDLARETAGVPQYQKGFIKSLVET